MGSNPNILTPGERDCLRWVHDFGLEHGRGPRPNQVAPAFWAPLNRCLVNGLCAQHCIFPREIGEHVSLHVTPLGLALLERAETSGDGGDKEVPTNKHAENIATPGESSTREVRSAEAGVQ